MAAYGDFTKIEEPFHLAKKHSQNIAFAGDNSRAQLMPG
jgi:hypothetical protein